MKLSGFTWGHRMNAILGVCLCIVLVGLVTAGAFVYANQSYTGGMPAGIQVCNAEPLQQNYADYAPSAIGGNEPVIQVFKADPVELDTPDAAAVYTFKVRHAKGIQIIEAGNNIKDISNPSGATLQGTATGLPAAAIPTDASGKFITVLMASNDYGSVKAELTLSLTQELLPPSPPAEPTGAQTGQWTPQWGPLMRAPLTSTPSNVINDEPKFFKCSGDCDHCLKPDEAANMGYTQRCSEELCYYSPDKQQKWYCYKPAPGWCCINGKVGQTTKDECTKIGGFWSIYQAEAMEACQPKGYCCLNGQVYFPTTESECAQARGSYWSTNRAQTMERCQPPTCWCCLKGEVYETTQDRCIQSGGACYSTQSQAAAACKPIYQTPTYR
jgi:hypothetical protein